MSNIPPLRRPQAVGAHPGLPRLEHLNQLPPTATLTPAEIVAMFNGLAAVFNRVIDVINAQTVMLNALASEALADMKAREQKDQDTPQ